MTAMRTFAISSLLIASTVLTVEVAHADDRHAVFATREVHLRSRPGEAGEVVGVADTGERMTVVGRHGRWLRVRHNRRVGWVTRTEVEDRDREQEPRTRPERSGFSGAPAKFALKVNVIIDKVRGFDDPETKANAVLDLNRGDTVTVIGRGHDGWILVEGSEGLVGWIPAVTVTDSGKFLNDPRGPASEVPLVDGTDEPTVASSSTASSPAASSSSSPASSRSSSRLLAPASDRRMEGGLLATAGAQTFAMRQVASGGAEALATATGPATAINAAARMRVSGALWLGGSADAELGTASLVYYTAAETSAAMPTSDMTVDAHADVAWGDTWQLMARAGYHYASLSIESDRTDAMLVGEKVGGITIGFGGSYPISPRFTVAASIDAMPSGVQQPTELPPGILYATAMRAAWARTTVSFKLPAHLVGAVSYRGGVASADLTDGHDAPTTARRTDQSHTITAGVGLSW